MALFGAGLFLPALAVGVLTLSGSLLIFGGGFGAINVSANAQAVTVERAYGKPIMSSFHALFSLGGIAGAGIGSLASAHHIPLKTHFAVMGLCVVAMATLLWKNLLRDLPHLAADKSGISYSSKLAILGAIAFCSSLGEGSMADWSAVYLRQVSMATPPVAALGFAAFSLSMTTGRFAADRITVVFGSVRLVQTGCGLAASGILLAVLIPHSLFAIIGFGCVGAGLAALIPTLFRAAGHTVGVSPSVAHRNGRHHGLLRLSIRATGYRICIGMDHAAMGDAVCVRRLLCGVGFIKIRGHQHGSRNRPDFCINCAGGRLCVSKVSLQRHNQIVEATCSINSRGQPISPTIISPRYSRAPDCVKPTFSATNVTVRLARMHAPGGDAGVAIQSAGQIDGQHRYARMINRIGDRSEWLPRRFGQTSAKDRIDH